MTIPDRELDDERDIPDEPSFCGRRGKTCRWVFSFCDYHLEMGDAEYHARRDRELEEE